MKQDGLKDKLYLNHLWTAWYGNSMKDLVEKPKVQWMGCTYLIPNLIEKLPEWEIFEHYCKLQASLMQARRRWSSRPPFPQTFCQNNKTFLAKHFSLLLSSSLFSFEQTKEIKTKKRIWEGVALLLRKKK